jgi:hypothetical protein
LPAVEQLTVAVDVAVPLMEAGEKVTPPHPDGDTVALRFTVPLKPFRGRMESW